MTERVALRGPIETLLICTRSGAGLEVTDRLPAPGLTATSWAPSGGELAVLDLNGKRIQLIEFGSEGARRRPAPRTLPKGSRGKSLLFAAHGLFVGGGGGGSSDSLWRLRGGGPQAIALPQGTGGRGKCVDHLFQVDDLLVAVDDMIFPKWTVTFRMDEFGGVRAETVYPLRVHGPNSVVVRGATGTRLVCLYSTSRGRTGFSAHLSLMDKRELDEVGHASARFGSGQPSGPTEPPLRLVRGGPPDPDAELRAEIARLALARSPRMAFVGDTLVLGSAHGLFCLDMEGIDLGVPSGTGRRAKRGLTQREYDVLALRMLEPDDPMPLAEVGERLGLSRERVRQIEVLARRKLASPEEAAERGLGLGPSRHLELPPIRQVTSRPVLDVAGIVGEGCAVVWSDGDTGPEWMPLAQLQGAQAS